MIIKSGNQEKQIKYMTSPKVQESKPDYDAIEKSLNPVDTFSFADIPEPRLIPEGTFMNGFRLGLGASIDPIGLACEGFPEDSKSIHDNSITTIAQGFMKEDPRKTEFGKAKTIGMATGIAIGIGLNVLTNGIIPITTGIIDGLIHLGKKIKN